MDPIHLIYYLQISCGFGKQPHTRKTLPPTTVPFHNILASLMTNCLTHGAGWPSALCIASSYCPNTTLGSRADNSMDNTSHVSTICSLRHQNDKLVLHFLCQHAPGTTETQLR